jgi:hypothetical protein
MYDAKMLGTERHKEGDDTEMDRWTVTATVAGQMRCTDGHEESEDRWTHRHDES